MQVFTCDDRNQLVALHYNNIDRSSCMASSNVAPEEVPTFYRHWKRLMTAMHGDQAAALQLVLQPGNLIALDNWRVMHGRLAFHESSDRALAGCYLTQEDVTGRRIALEANFKCGISCGDTALQYFALPSPPS